MKRAGTAPDARALSLPVRLEGLDAYLAELVPAVEMAWADGAIQPEEQLALQAYCFELTRGLNQTIGRTVFTAAEALRLLEVLMQRRLPAPARGALVDGLAKLFARAPHGPIARERMLHWSRVVAEAAGKPAWHEAEVQWMRTLRARFDVP